MDSPVFLALQVHLVEQAWTFIKESPEGKVLPVFLDLKENAVWMDPLVYPVVKEIMDHQVLKDLLEKMDSLVLLAVLVLKVNKAHLVTTDFLELMVCVEKPV